MKKGEKKHTIKAVMLRHGRLNTAKHKVMRQYIRLHAMHKQTNTAANL